MSNAIITIQDALERAQANRPKVGGFPYLAETLRRAGAITNTWHLPSCQCLFETEQGAVVIQSEPLVMGFSDVAPFDSERLVRAIRADQAGESTFPEFLREAWESGVIRYVVDFEGRTVTYFGVGDEHYLEPFPAVDLP